VGRNQFISLTRPRTTAREIPRRGLCTQGSERSTAHFCSMLWAPNFCSTDRSTEDVRKYAAGDTDCRKSEANRIRNAGKEERIPREGAPEVYPKDIVKFCDALKRVYFNRVTRECWAHNNWFWVLVRSAGCGFPWADDFFSPRAKAFGELVAGKSVRC
jgi:hypothetical protein